MKKALFAFLYYAGVTRFAAWWNRRRVVFLCYHGVTGSSSPGVDDPKGLHVNRERFAQQLSFLRKRHQIISLEDYLTAAPEGRKLPDYSVVLTFDDGFRNFLTAAAPLLMQSRIPATVFLITDYTTNQNGDKPATAWIPEDDTRYLSWKEARMLKESGGFTFGSHTCSHSRLLTLSLAETERELLHSFNHLVRNLGIEKPSLSYPKGEHSPLLADDACKLGYACAVTTDRGANELDHDRFTLGRTLIGDHDDEAAFAVRVSGLRWWLVRIASFFAWRQLPARTQAEPETVPYSPSLQPTD